MDSIFYVAIYDVHLRTWIKLRFGKLKDRDVPSDARRPSPRRARFILQKNRFVNNEERWGLDIHEQRLWLLPHCRLLDKYLIHRTGISDIQLFILGRCKGKNINERENTNQRESKRQTYTKHSIHLEHPTSTLTVLPCRFMMPLEIEYVIDFG